MVDKSPRIPDRRTVLKAIGASSIASFSSNASAERPNDRPEVPEDVENKLRNKYTEMTAEEQRSAMEAPTTAVLDVLATPSNENDFLQESLPARFVEANWQLIEEPSIAAFASRIGFRGLSIYLKDGTPTAALSVKYYGTDYEISLVAEPEVDHGHAIVSHDQEPKNASKTLVIAEDEGEITTTTSACIEGQACRGGTCHSTPCTNRTAPFTHEIVCCSDSCYWGSNTCKVCDYDNSCPDCEYHCGFRDSC